MLQFNPAWRFDSPGPLPLPAVSALAAIIGRLAGQGDRKRTLEHFKVYFASVSGETASVSSNLGWAQSDLDGHIRAAAQNAPLFIEAFYDGCLGLKEMQPDLALPDLDHINRLLAQYDAGFQVIPPKLVPSREFQPITVEPPPSSLDEQARATIEDSLAQAQRLLDEGRSRQAVQEILWLLETVATAFQGVELEEATVEGKYFNTIAKELRRHRRGTTLDQVLGWVTTLHGYLSSPTGGGVRHGANLRAGVGLQANEARLYCNLIRSYIAYLLGEYERLQRHG